MQNIKEFSGLTVYIPQAAYPEANEFYGKLKWAKRINQPPPTPSKQGAFMEKRNAKY